MHMLYLPKNGFTLFPTLRNHFCLLNMQGRDTVPALKHTASLWHKNEAQAANCPICHTSHFLKKRSLSITHQDFDRVTMGSCLKDGNKLWYLFWQHPKGILNLQGDSELC